MTSLFWLDAFFAACAAIQAFKSAGNRSCIGLRLVIGAPHPWQLAIIQIWLVASIASTPKYWHLATMNDAPPSAGQDKFIVRLPDGMRDQIKAMADLNGRSMNAEIVYRLQQTLSPEGNMRGFLTTALMNALADPQAQVTVNLDRTPPDQRDNPHWINHIEVRVQDGRMLIPNPNRQRESDK